MMLQEWLLVYTFCPLIYIYKKAPQPIHCGGFFERPLIFPPAGLAYI